MELISFRNQLFLIQVILAMKLNVVIEPSHYFNSVHELARLAFYGWELKQDAPDGAQASLYIRVAGAKAAGHMEAEIVDSSGKHEYSVLLKLVPDMHESEIEIQIRKELRIFVYKLLCLYTGRNINPYGLLTGMRPVKAAQRLLDSASDPDGLEELLAREYLTNGEKSALLAEVARNSRPYLHPRGEAVRKISLYAGIPYCPSRCRYCSFPGAVLRDYQQEIPAFLACLHREIDELSGCLRELRLDVENIYIGGGTPSILNDDDLEKLLEAINQGFSGDPGREISVEAGRADTLSRSKLEIMSEAGVRRICINPQTMQDQTLVRIGRLHDTRAVEEAVDLARQAGFKTINMDLIAGLEGEEQVDYEASCRRVLALLPENVTVHSLAVKKGSRLAREYGFKPVEGEIGAVEKALRYFEKSFRNAGYRPYYLYRQKYMRDNMENIGFALPGHICRYNVQMIEERQTILGIGGGASSKFVDNRQQLKGAFYNPKDPYFYCRDIERLVQTKVDKLRAIF